MVLWGWSISFEASEPKYGTPSGHAEPARTTTRLIQYLHASKVNRPRIPEGAEAGVRFMRSGSGGAGRVERDADERNARQRWWNRLQQGLRAVADDGREADEAIAIQLVEIAGRYRS